MAIDKDKILNKKKVGVQAPLPNSLTFSCGHSYPTEVVTKRICLGCKEKEIQNTNKKAKENRKKKREKLLKDGGWKGKASKHLERLPHMSQFDVSYSSEKQEWFGQLNIYTPNNDGKRWDILHIFHGKEAAVFKLLAELDAQYRKWLEEQAKPKE